MGIIRTLSKDISELIAAGEVVERPASAIKELVENSIDAGAKNITVELKQGGSTYLRVSDDGCGMTEEDAHLAFKRHATSKIYRAEDLDCITSLGFRGEALASIAAVSKVELITREKNNNTGTRLVLEAGEIVSSQEYGCPAGTTIIVRDLFYNVPARQKFLKKDSTEAAAVATIIQKLSLSHPEISFKLIKDGKEELHTTGDNKLISAVYSVFGKEVAKGLIPIEYKDNGISVHGFISTPTASRSSRNLQTFFVNKRFIHSRLLLTALEESYKNSIQSGRFPYCFINIQIDPSYIDVNIHPAKTEIRFRNEKEIFEILYRSCRLSLLNDSTLVQFRPEPKVIPLFPDKQIETERQETISSFPDKTKPPYPNDTIINLDQLKGNVTYINQLQDTDDFLVKSPANNIFLSDKRTNENVTEDYIRDESTFLEQASEAVLIGELFQTYILAEQGESLLLVDKHAVHERIIYEKLKNEYVSQKQMLLESVPVSLTADEYNICIENLELFNNAGFELEDFGHSCILVRAVPVDLNNEDIPSLICEIIEYISQNKKDLTGNKLDWIFHSVACRAAVKARDKSSELELKELLNTALSDKRIRFCPHGRPCIIELPKQQIEKMFGRL